MQLYKLTEATKEVAALLDEGVPFEQLEETLKELDCDFQEKAKNILFAIANLEAEAGMADAEIKRLSARKTTKANQVVKLREYLLVNMQETKTAKIDNGVMAASIRNGAPTLVITDEELIPVEYKNIKTSITTDRKGLLKALKELEEGKTIEGAEVGAGKNTLTIKQRFIIMGKSVNKVQIIGTLGRDPEMKYLPSGSAVVSVSVATDESYQDKQSGQKVEKTEWHRLTGFGKVAEIIGQYLKKGSKAYFEGKLRTNEYEKDGIKRYSTEIVINDMMMLDGRQDGQQGQSMQQPAQQGGFAPQQPVQQPQQQGGFAPQSQQQTRQHPQNAARVAPLAQQPQAAPQPANNFDSFSDDIPF